MKQKIAVLCCGWAHLYLTKFFNGMKRALKDSDTDVYIFNGYNYTEYSGFPNFTGYSIFNLINYEDFDGIIILSDLINNPRILERERLRILKAQKPVISINKMLNGITTLKVDNYTSSIEMMDHLATVHGCKDFGYIGGKETSIDLAERYKAFRTYLTDNKLPINPDHIFTVQSCSYENVYAFFDDYLGKGKELPEVLVCANDIVALGVYEICKKYSIKIPDQMKVIGYDDEYFAKNLTPGLTTVQSKIESIGAEAAKRVLFFNGETRVLKAKNVPVYRCSCGCDHHDSQNRGHDYLELVTGKNKSLAFTSQMESLEEVFTEAPDVFTLLTNLELFFAKSHNFEGRDFCIFLKSDWTSVLINSEENLPLSLTYGNQVQAISAISNNEKYPRVIINTKDLVPKNMITEGSNMFFILPIYYHSYVFGYYVAKNNFSLLDNSYGYTWTRNFGTSIERFRKRNMYKQMSHEFLKLSTKDALSGMLNRVGMDKLAKPFYAANKKNGLTTVLFFVDINSMKTINDKFGHLHGDLAVKTIAASVLQVVPKNWMCVRYGGDEFLVVGNSKNYNGEDYCTKIEEVVLQKASTMHLPYKLSASVGTINIPANSDLTLEQAVEKVDEIMYEKKQQFHKENGREV
ncbi:MAG: GGDEF domain-containing protein [Treponema sp.]|nr:GGDEF domain-containing protein [Candidatus Treponema merdequi]